MSSISKFSPEITDFRKTMTEMLNKIHTETTSMTKKRVSMIIDIIKYMSNDTFWVTEYGGEVFVPLVIDKCYLITRYIPVFSDEPTKDLEYIDSALKIYCCNKRVENRFCENKKVGKYCSVHTDIHNKILEKVSEETEKSLNKDLIGLLCSFIEL